MQNLFSRSPWERPSVVPLRSAILGQTSPNCEPTPEGGQRCADGTYYPPGCKPGSGSGIPAEAPTPGAMVPLLVAGAAAAAAAGAYFLLAGQRRAMGEEPARYPIVYPYDPSIPQPVYSVEVANTFSQLRSIAEKINEERANDAYFFAKYIEASKRRQDLVVAEGVAEKTLAAQEKIWNDTHRNPDEYKAAQVALDQISADKGAAAQEMEENRAGINTAAQNIMTYRNNAEVIISQLPEKNKTEGAMLIDPCSFRKPTMEGRGYGRGSYSGFNGFGNQMTYGTQQTSEVIQEGSELPAYGPGTAMMGRRYPVINSR